MKRRINILICFALGLLCCATILSWARSYVSSEAIGLSRRFERYTLVGSEGRAVFVHGKLKFASPESWEAWRGAIDPNVDVYKWSFSILNDVSPVPTIEGSFAGFGAQQSEVDVMRRRQIPGVTWRRTMVQAPFWMLVALTGAWPALWVWRRSRVRGARISQGLCRHCGFDLAGVYYSCPKCGQRLPLPAFEVIARAK